MISDHKETKIAKRAYELWEKQGRPHGRDAEHWHQAAAEFTNGASAPAETPKAKPARKKAAAAASPAKTRKGK